MMTLLLLLLLLMATRSAELNAGVVPWRVAAIY